MARNVEVKARIATHRRPRPGLDSQPHSRIGSSYRKCLTAAARNAGCWAATMRDSTRERARGLAAEPRGPVNLYHLGSL
jgi:hypothetical protein